MPFGRISIGDSGISGKIIVLNRVKSLLNAKEAT